jgi:hypothetical protein
MKHYMLTVCYPPTRSQPQPEQLGKIVQDVTAVQTEMQSAGVWVFAGGLHPPSTATVVEYRNDGALVTDGPFAEGKEHIGGFTVVRVADLDAALEWGRKLSRATTCPIEVWPFQGQCTE